MPEWKSRSDSWEGYQRPPCCAVAVVVAVAAGSGVDAADSGGAAAVNRNNKEISAHGNYSVMTLTGGGRHMLAKQFGKEFGIRAGLCMMARMSGQGMHEKKAHILLLLPCCHGRPQAVPLSALFLAGARGLKVLSCRKRARVFEESLLECERTLTS